MGKTKKRITDITLVIVYNLGGLIGMYPVAIARNDVSAGVEKFYYLLFAVILIFLFYIFSAEAEKKEEWFFRVVIPIQVFFALMMLAVFSIYQNWQVLEIIIMSFLFVLVLGIVDVIGFGFFRLLVLFLNLDFGGF